MSATWFGLYLGHPQACQYKNLTKEGIKIPPIDLMTRKEKLLLPYALSILQGQVLPRDMTVWIFGPSNIAKCRLLCILGHAVITHTLFYQNKSTVMFTWGLTSGAQLWSCGFYFGKHRLKKPKADSEWKLWHGKDCRSVHNLDRWSW